MKRFLYKSAILMMVFGLAACGYSLEELYDGDSYNSSNFADNYYTRWDKDIAYKASKNKITNPDAEVINLNKTTDRVFTKYGEGNFRIVESKYDDYVYETDSKEEINAGGKLPYGPNNNLNDIDDSFRYGLMSRLFDGQLFCNGVYEKARVQINSQGFGRTFPKELFEIQSPTPYFALSLKTSIEFRRIIENDDGEEVNIDIARWWSGSGLGTLTHDTSIALTINFFLKNENGYERVPVYYEIDDIPCNQSDNSSRNNYVLFGFEIGKNVPSLDRCAGISIEYTYNDPFLDEMNSRIDEINASNLSNPYFDSEENEPSRTLYGGDIQHSILLYEIMFPNSIWH